MARLMSDHGVVQIARTAPAPAWFKLVIALPHARRPLLRQLRAMGALDRIASFKFYGTRVVAPLSDYEGGWRCEFSGYQIRRVARFAMMCDGFMGDFDLIDCGAYLGLVAAQFARCSAGVRKLTAIEPNSQLFPLMEFNLREARVAEVECINAALANFQGRGRLVAPDYNAGPDARFLVEDASGDVDVITLSSVLRGRTRPNVAIKIDVEGQEAPVLCAAEDDIRSLQKVVLFVEVHRQVLDRIGMSDIELMKQINGIRPFRWVRASDGAPIIPERSVLAEFGVTQCDAIGISE